MINFIPQVKPNSLSKQTKIQQAANSIGKVIPDKLAKTFEMTQTGSIPRMPLVLLSFLFVLGARFVKARDAHERREILTRDGITIGAAMLGVPVLKNILSKTIQKVSKIPIADTTGKNWISLDDFGLDNVKNWYSKADKMPSGILTLAENIKKRGGDIKTAFEKLGDEGMQHVKTILNGAECTSDNILAGLQKAANATENFTKDDKFYKSACDSLTKILSKSDNGLVKTAQRLKAIPALASLIGVTALLGWAIPAFNIYFTRTKLHANKNNEEKSVSTIHNEPTNNVYNNVTNSNLSNQQKELISAFLKKA